MASAKHTEIHRDESGRLHNESGQAIAWADGFGVYALHGVRVPREWVEQRDSLDPRLALTHPNVEQRRALRDMLGWKRVLEHIEHSVVDTDSDPEVGTLIECVLDDDGDRKARFLKMLCATGREFVERVDPNCETAIAAQNWRWGLKAGEYQLEERT